MANLYLDPSAVGNEYQAYTDTPTTWAVPQDGNGLAGPGHAAAVPLCEVTATTYAPPGAGSVSVYGTTVTLSGVLGAGDNTALAAALASSINATTTVVPATVSSMQLPLNRFVYARAKPGFPATVQVMCRFAGSNLNYPAHSSARIVSSINSGGLTPVNADFTGGADGPWGYFANDGTVFGKTQGNYGLMAAKSPTPTEPGTPDCVHVRTKRSGANLTQTITATTQLTIRTPTNAVRNFLFDNGTTWSGDNGQYTLRLVQNALAQVTNFQNGAGGWTVLNSRDKYGFRLLIKMEPTTLYWAAVGAYSSGLFEMTRCLVEAEDATSKVFLGLNSGVDERFTFNESKALLRRNMTLSAAWNGNYNVFHRYQNSVIEYAGIGSAVTSLFSASGNIFSSYYGGEILFDGCEVLVDGGAFGVGAFFTGGSNITSQGSGHFRVANCKGIPNPSMGFGPSPWQTPKGPTFTWTDTATGSFRYERAHTMTEYVAGNGYPTLGVSNAAGGVMSYRFSWEAARLTDSRAQHEVGRFTLFYKDTSAVKTCDIELLVPTAEIPKKSQIALTVTYVDSGGVSRNETSWENSGIGISGTGTALAAGVGTGSWVGTTTGLSSVKASLTTAYAVKQNSEISARLLIVGAPTGTHSIYVSPEIRVS